LLVVISIVGLLAGLVTVAVPRAMEAGKKAKAKGELTAVIAALKAYKQEYGQWPTASGDRSEDEWFGG
jgi:type II secretory pathway pseudopilin PulG